MKNLVPRIISGIVYVVLIVFGTTGPSWLFAGLMGLFLLMCYIEFIRMAQLKDKFYLVLSFLAVSGIFYYFTFYLFEGEAVPTNQSLSYAGPVLFFLACLTIMFSENELRQEFGKATVAVIYTAAPFSLALTLPTVSYELGKQVISPEILYVFILIWVSDVMAYVVGSLWGKHKMAPLLSAGKTWEGAVGGFVFTVLAGYLLHIYFQGNTDLNWLGIGLLVGICAPCGDLIESKLKRIFNVKDSGSLIPGHGGFLDRLDSFIFVIPVLYLYLLIF